jgi:serine/threonine-protein kinase RsbT
MTGGDDHQDLLEECLVSGGDTAAESEKPDEVEHLAPLVRRVVAARVAEPYAVEDLVQETLTRILAVQHRLDGSALAPYAVVTARNLTNTLWRARDRERRHKHRLVDTRAPRRPDEAVVGQEEARAVAAALSRLSAREREALVAHEVEGRDTRSLADELGCTPGTVATRLHRARARLRVEYLIEMERAEPPTNRCRRILVALSSGDQRRQQELDAGQHLLECDYCSTVSDVLLERQDVDEGVARIRVETEADVVLARQRVREIAATVGFSESELVFISTAASEIARNIVQFADRGHLLVSRIDEDTRQGVQIIARDVGRGIEDLELATSEGYSSYGGMGLGLPGCRRLMDEFEIESEVDRGTTVTMKKWRRR